MEVEELSKLKARIPQNGIINLPLVGQIPAAGRAPPELEEQIAVLLREKHMHDPHVSVLVLEQQSQRITIIGAVARPGVFPLIGRMRLTDALATAGGTIDDAGRRAFLTRRTIALNGAKGPDQTTVAVDLEELASGREDLNLPVEGGDVIDVPRAGSYYVGGSIERPGSLSLRAPTTLAQAIVAAGGVKDVADWTDIRIYRTTSGGDREVLTFDLNKIEDGGLAPEVMRNDVIIVGKSKVKAFLYGLLDVLTRNIGLAALAF